MSDKTHAFTVLAAEFGSPRIPDGEVLAAFPALIDYSAAINRAFDSRQALRRVWLNHFRPGWRDDGANWCARAGF